MTDAESQKKEILKRQKNAKTNGAICLILSEISLFLLILFFSSSGPIWSIIFSTAITIFPILFLVIYYILAPVKVVGYFVDQNKYLFVEEGGAFKRPSPRCNGKDVNEDGLLIPNKGPYPKNYILFLKIASGIGLSKIEIHGLRFFEWFGLFEYAPMKTVKRNKYIPRKGKEPARIEYREDVAWDGWLTNLYPYGFEIVREYTQDNIPVSFKIGGFGRSENPPLTAYGIEDWWTSLDTDITGTVSNKIRITPYKVMREHGENLGNFFYGAFYCKDIKEISSNGNPILVSGAEKIKRYGMVMERFQITEFSVPPEVLEAAEAPVKQKYEMQTVELKAEMNRKQVTVELSSVLDIFLSRTCMSIEDYAEEMRDPEGFRIKFGEIWDQCENSVLERIGMREKSVIRVNSSGDVGQFEKTGVLYKKMDQLGVGGNTSLPSQSKESSSDDSKRRHPRVKIYKK